MTSVPPSVPARPSRWLFRGLLIAGLLALGVLNVLLYGQFATPAGSLRIVMRSTVASKIQVYFDVGYGYVEGLSTTLPVAAGPKAQTFSFPLPPLPVQKVRIDPLENPGTVNIHSVSVVRDRDHHEVSAIQIESIDPQNEVDSLTPDIEGLEVVTPPKATDPELVLTPIRPISVALTPFERGLWLLLLDLAVVPVLYGALRLVCFGLPPGLRFLARWPHWLRWPVGPGRAVRRLPLPGVWALLALALPVFCDVCFLAAKVRETYYLEVVLSSDRPAIIQFYYDAGWGFSEELSATVPVPASPRLRPVRFPVFVHTLTGLRFDPSEGPVAMRVKSMSIRSAGTDRLQGKPLYSFDLRTLWPVQQMRELVHENDGTIRLLVPDGVNDPATSLTLPAPLHLGVDWPYVLHGAQRFALLWLPVWLVAALLGRWWLTPGRLACVWAAWRRAASGRLTPRRAVWLVAAASVVLSCYPVVFCGRSFASPNFLDGSFQLYQGFPTLPGTRDALVETGRGADVTTMAWRAAPNAVVASRALLRDHELPLWNRYNNGGVPLLGQGQSMLGDPLHWLVLAAGGRAWAWDTKFVLAKWLFTAGVGLLVFTATESLPAALLLSASAAFIGFFGYRLNHPAYFSLCYAPWLLLCWLEIVRAGTWRRTVGWTGGLLLANWAELNSGALGEALTAVVWLNACGVLLLLVHPSVPWRWRRLLGVAAGVGILVLVGMPPLLAMLDLLKHTVLPSSPAGLSRQLPSGLFLGLFDDIFYRQATLHESVLAPATNLLVLAGLLLALSRFKPLLGNRTFLVVLVSALLPLAVVFGALPDRMAAALPFAAIILQPDAAYADVLILFLFILAGFGLKECWRLTPRRQWWRDWFVALLMGTGLLAAFFVFIHSPDPTEALGSVPLSASHELSSFFEGYAALTLTAAALLPWVLRRLRLRGPALDTLFLLAACLVLIHWRQGLQLDGRFARYTPVLPNRVNLLARSPALDLVAAEDGGAVRAVGLGGILTPGYNGIPGVEVFDGREPMVSPYVTDLKWGGMKLTDAWLRDATDKKRLAETKRFYDVFNVRCYLTQPGDSLAAIPGLRLAKRLDLDVYRNDGAWPRAFFVDRLELYEGFDQFKAMVLGYDGKPFAAIDINELRQTPEVVGRFEGGEEGRVIVPAVHYRLTSGTTAFDVTAPHAGVILLHEAFYAGMVSAEVNGKPVHVFRANHAFCGVVVDEPGLCHVKVTYRSPQFGLAWYASVLGMVLLVGIGCWLRWGGPSTAMPKAQ